MSSIFGFRKSTSDYQFLDDEQCLDDEVQIQKEPNFIVKFFKNFTWGRSNSPRMKFISFDSNDSGQSAGGFIKDCNLKSLEHKIVLIDTFGDGIEKPEAAQSSGGIGGLLATIGVALGIIPKTKSQIKDAKYDKEVKASLRLDLLLYLPIRLFMGIVTVAVGLKNYANLGGKFVLTMTSSLFLRINCITGAVFSTLEIARHSYRLKKQVQFANQFDFKLINKIEQARGERNPRVKSKLCHKIGKMGKKIVFNSEKERSDFNRLLEQVERGVGLDRLEGMLLKKNLSTLRKKYFCASSDVQERKGKLRELSKRVGVGTVKQLLNQYDDDKGIGRVVKSLHQNIAPDTTSLKNGVEIIHLLEVQNKKHRNIHMIGVASAVLSLASTILFLVSIPTFVPIVLLVVSLLCYGAYLYYYGSLEKVGETEVSDNIKYGFQKLVEPGTNLVTGVASGVEKTGKLSCKAINKGVNKFNKEFRPDAYRRTQQNIIDEQEYRRIKQATYGYYEER